MSKPLVLITGGTGFAGSHTVLQLLEQGFPVRAVVRKAKVESFKKTYPNAGKQLEVAEISDFVNGDFTEALKGVGALLHIAAPTYVGDATNKEILHDGVEGTVNIVRQAIKAGVKKIIATSSLVALISSDFSTAFATAPLTEGSWNEVTIDQVDIEKQPGMVVYVASKTIAERKFWELAKENPGTDFTIIVPPAIYGGTVPNFPRPAVLSGLSTIEFVSQLIRGSKAGKNTWPDSPIAQSVHVKDIAKAHILAISAPPLPDGKQKRILVSNGLFTWPEAVELIKKERPQVASRLPDPKLEPPAQTKAPMDVSLAQKVLGMKEFIPWQTGVLEALDATLEWEKGEKA